LNNPAELGTLADKEISLASAPLPLDTSVPDKVSETETEHQAAGWRLSPSRQQSEVKIMWNNYGTHVGGLLNYAKSINNAL
jgi:hypothetical protein